MDTLHMQVHGKEAAQRMTLTMEPGSFPQLEITQNGVTRYKTVGWHQLLNLLDHSIVVEKLKNPDVRTVTIPRLPERTLLVDVVETAMWKDVFLTGWIPATEYPFVYDGHSYLCRIPTMIYRVRWCETDNTLGTLSLCVTTDDVATVDSPLYRWLFSNVYPGGNVCWTSKVECELHEVIEKAVFGFLQTPNNRDLFGQSSSQNSPYRDYDTFLTAVRDTNGVDPEWLIPRQETVPEFHQRNRTARY